MTVVVVDCQTGQVIERPMTAAEIAALPFTPADE